MYYLDFNFFIVNSNHVAIIPILELKGPVPPANLHYYIQNNDYIKSMNKKHFIGVRPEDSMEVEDTINDKVEIYEYTYPTEFSYLQVNGGSRYYCGYIINNENAEIVQDWVQYLSRNFKCGEIKIINVDKRRPPYRTIQAVYYDKIHPVND